MPKLATRHVGLFDIMGRSEGKHHCYVEVAGDDLSPAAFASAVKKIKCQAGPTAHLERMERSAKRAKFYVRTGLNSALRLFERILARINIALNERVVRPMTSSVRYAGHAVRPTPTQKLAPEASGA